MEIQFACPRCQRPHNTSLAGETQELACECGWSRPVVLAERADLPVETCVACGCGDLWRQKDFPQKLGLFMVVLGAGLSTLAWKYYLPQWALGILLLFAAIDMVLFAVMRDVLVCYRCGARYRKVPGMAATRTFDLETAERYRQEAARQAEMTASHAAPK